jgi:hypothetical protein
MGLCLKGDCEYWWEWLVGLVMLESGVGPGCCGGQRELEWSQRLTHRLRNVVIEAVLEGWEVIGVIA